MSEEIKSNDLKSYKKGTIIINGEIFPPLKEIYNDKASKNMEITLKKMKKYEKRMKKNKIKGDRI